MRRKCAYLVQRDLTLKTKASGDSDQANRLIEQNFMLAANAYQDAMLALLTSQREGIDATAAEIEHNYESSKSILFALVVLLVACSVACIWVLRRSVLGQLGGEPSYATGIAHSIAAGDLSAQVDCRTRQARWRRWSAHLG